MADYLEQFAQERNLKHYRDHANNVVIYKDATAGYEEAKPLILQGHIDMVCAKDKGSFFDFHNDSLEPYVDGDFVRARGTSLGADDGIAVAMFLAILDAPEGTLKHPRLECVFTANDTVGLQGAMQLDVSQLEGRRMINLDSQEEGTFVVSCAGGINATHRFLINRKPETGREIGLEIKGLQGGHSGLAIDKGRANALKLMGRLLYNLTDKVKFNLVTLEGGEHQFAICNRARASIIVNEPSVEVVQAIIAERNQIYAKEYENSDPGVEISMEVMDFGTHSALTAMDTDRMMAYVMAAPHGILFMRHDIEGVVETSINMGKMRLEKEEFHAEYSIRSSVDTKRKYIVDRLTTLGWAFSAVTTTGGEYPGWNFRRESPLRETATEVYIRQNGKAPEIKALHAGMECGIFAGKLGPETDIISTGPQVLDAHTINERLSISSTQRVWEFLVQLLAECR